MKSPDLTPPPSTPPASATPLDQPPTMSGPRRRHGPCSGLSRNAFLVQLNVSRRSNDRPWVAYDHAALSIAFERSPDVLTPPP
jgi:hypothetical protein